MAKAFVKYMVVFVAVSVWSILLYMFQSKTMVRQTDPTENLKTRSDTPKDHFNDSKYFHVDKYNLYNGTLELRGQFSDLGLSEIKSLYIKRLSPFISQGITSEEKLETSRSANRSFSLSVGRHVRDASCRLLIRGEQNETKRAEKLTEQYPRVATTPREYIQMSNNCSKFVIERGYIMDALSKVEKEFPISFSILMYRDVEQSERLLRAIFRPQNTYCIHVDSKSSDNIFEAMKNIANCFENVFIASNRYNVKWGTMTVLEPELLCMEELWNKSKSWKYFINLTGQEFPLKTNYELVQILKAYNGANDLEGIVERANKDRWKDAGTAPHGIVPVKGAVHIAASRGYVDFALHDQRARDFLEWTRLTSVPDETFFATLNHNPFLGVPGSYKGYPETEMKDNIKPYVARFKNWGDGHYNWPCKGKWVRNICVFGIGDLPLLVSRRELFANKFFLDYHHFALDCLEEHLFNKTRDEYLGKLSFDVRWYSRLGFVSNKVD